MLTAPSRCPFMRALADAVRAFADWISPCTTCAGCPASTGPSDCACAPGTICTANAACPRTTLED